MDYTLAVTTYKLDDRVDKCIDFWFNLPMPPKKIIVLDDGNTYKTDRENVIVKYFDNCHNTAYMRNYAVDNLIETEKFILSEPSVFPYTNTIETLAKLSHKDKLICGINVATNKLEFPELRMSKILIRTDDIWSPEITIRHKSTFPYYNEIYKGWGGEDNDIGFRWLNGGKEIWYCSDVKFIHWDHPKFGDFYNEEKTKRNREILAMVLQKYKMLGTYKLKKEEKYSFI